MDCGGIGETKRHDRTKAWKDISVESDNGFKYSKHISDAGVELLV